MDEATMNAERHAGGERAVCVGQWCCGCQAHPVGKPWGWNWRAWGEHYRSAHPERRPESQDGEHEHQWGNWQDDPAGVVRECACGAIDWRPEG